MSPEIHSLTKKMHIYLALKVVYINIHRSTKYQSAYTGACTRSKPKYPEKTTDIFRRLHKISNERVRRFSVIIWINKYNEWLTNFATSDESCIDSHSPGNNSHTVGVRTIWWQVTGEVTPSTEVTPERRNDCHRCVRDEDVFRWRLQTIYFLNGWNYVLIWSLWRQIVLAWYYKQDCLFPYF